MSTRSGRPFAGAGPRGVICAVAAGWLVACAVSQAQPPLVRYGDPVPRDVRDIYDAGLRYLLRTQDASGAWKDGQAGPGVTGMAVMVMLASGDDPNHGPHAVPLRKAQRSMIGQQAATTGFMSGDGNPSMYQHGFAMLALAETYGAVDDRTLWSNAGGEGRGRSIGQSLELAVRAAVTAGRKNPLGGWHYGPDMPSADTSVSGAVFMGLLAARNAGIEVPDETIDRAIKYYQAMTGGNGQVGYSGGPGGGSDAVTSIGVLVYSIARRKDLPQYAKAIEYLGERTANPQGVGDNHAAYTRYYRAQALFQGDVDGWARWNERLVREVKAVQAKDGSVSWPQGGISPMVDTALTMLSLAVNYKFLPIYER